MKYRNMEKIVAIVVTFNKKELLVNAINGILSQDLLPDKLVIVDNNSDDGTPIVLLENGWIDVLPQVSANKDIIYSKKYAEIEIDYIRKFENDGGAGGFYRGMVHSYELGYDWLWMMDDDGVPEKQCLKFLYESRDLNIVSGPLVIDIENKETASFIYDKKTSNKFALVKDLVKEEILKNVLNAFNGTFIPREIIKEIGFVKKEMFIWGDENEYMFRIIKNNFSVQTITKALHFHPLSKQTYKYRSTVFKFTIYEIANPKFMYIRCRNAIYLEKIKENKVLFGVNIPLFRVVYEAIVNSIYNFAIGEFYKSKLCLSAIPNGLRGDFSMSKFK